MGFRSAGIGLGAALALSYAPWLGAEGVVQVTGVAIDRSELGAGGPAAELGRLYDLVWKSVSRHYIGQHGLNASREEISEVERYEREFNRQDRAQRARKLAQLEARLAGGDLAPAERARAEEFRAVLARLARGDAEADRAPPADPERQAAHYAYWIELWKMNRALYEQYGGVVGLTGFGPYPHGARVALLEDYERRGLLKFSDPRLRERLYALLAARPSLTLAPEQVDFTPFWKLPIPSSYFPD